MRSLLPLSLAVWLLAGFAVMPPPVLAADENKVDLKVGDTGPEFGANDESGQAWKLADHVGKKFLVVYFYPGDFTPGCTKQAETFRDNLNRLTDAGIEVIGISGDSSTTHALFKKAQKLNFTLLADEDGAVAKQFGVPLSEGREVKAKDADGKPFTFKRAVTAARWTFIIGKDGKILYKNTKVNPVQDSKEVAAFIENLEKK